MEETLIKSDKFTLPSKRKLLSKNSGINIVIIDATECETERPKKNKKRATQERKKRHTIKDQIIINGLTGQIICINEDKGSVHDFLNFLET